jgi:hypothetical protein
MLLDRMRCTGMKIMRKSCNSLCNITERSVLIYIQTDMQMFLMVTPCKHRLYCRSFEDPEAEPTVAWTFYSKSLKSSYVTYITKSAYGHHLYSVTLCIACSPYPQCLSQLLYTDDCVYLSVACRLSALASDSLQRGQQRGT